MKQKIDKWLMDHFTGLWGVHYQTMNKYGKFTQVKTISWWKGAPKLFLFLVALGLIYAFVQTLHWLFAAIGILFVAFVIYIGYLAKYNFKSYEEANDVEKENNEFV